MTMNKFKPLVLGLLCIFACSSSCSKEKEPQIEFERYVDDYVMHSEILGTDIFFSVLLPESYNTDKDRTYSVVYMLHGYGDNWKSWNGKYLHANSRIESLEASGKISEMIYVFPCGFTTYYCNFYTGKYNYMDMFVNEFIPYIDSKFRTRADKAHRAITGYSMGGFGAMVLPEKHPELFCCSAPLSMSFRTDDQYMAESQSGWDGQWGAIFGGTGEYGYGRLTPYYKEHCPFYQFTPQNKASLEQVRWFLTCGDDEEQLLVANDTLHTQLRNFGYEHEFRVGNGAHTSSYWMDALNEVLPWFDHCMNGGTAWPDVSFVNISKADISINDGIALSAAYSGEGDGGTGVYFVHKGLDDAFIEDAMKVMYSTNTKVKFVFLPCDISKKSIEEWIGEYSGAYPQTDRYAVAFGNAGNAVQNSAGLFSEFIYVDADIDTSIEADPGKTYLFACTDESGFHAGMGALYRSCKRSGAEFEYRVINSSEDPDADMLRCLGLLKSNITYQSTNY